MIKKSNAAFPLRIFLLAVLMEGYRSSPDLRQMRSSGQRQIEPYVCFDPDTRDEGMCMFAWNCKRANGTHLTFCMDRFYFGSCCKLPPEYYVTPASTTLGVSSDSSSNMGKFSTAKPAVVSKIISLTTLATLPGAKTSTKGPIQNHSLNTETAYPTVASFPPGLVTWRPLEAPHQVPEQNKIKLTTPLFNFTSAKYTTPFATKIKASTKQPFPSYPSRKTKPTISHITKFPKPTQSNGVKVPRPTKENSVTSPKPTTPNPVVRPRPTKVSRPTTPEAVFTSKTYSTDVSRPKTENPSTSPPATRASTISKIPTGIKSSRPTAPHRVKGSKPTVPHPHKVTRPTIPSEIFSSKPQSIKIPQQGVPHESSMSKPTVTKTPKPSVEISTSFFSTPPPHIVEILTPKPSSFSGIKESTTSVTNDKPSTTNKLVSTTSLSEPAMDNSTAQQQANLQINSSESGFIELLSTEDSISMTTLQQSKSTIRATEGTKMPVTSDTVGVGEVVEVTKIHNKEGTSGGLSMEIETTPSGQEEFDTSVTTSTVHTYPVPVVGLDAEVNEPLFIPGDVELSNDSTTIDLSLDFIYDSTLNGTTANSEVVSQTAEQYITAEDMTSSVLQFTESKDEQTTENVHSRKPEFPNLTTESTEKHMESFSTTSFKCNLNTQHPTTQEDLTTSEEISNQQKFSESTEKTEEYLTTEDSLQQQSDMTGITGQPESNSVTEAESQTSSGSYSSGMEEITGTPVAAISEMEIDYVASSEGSYDFSEATESQAQQQSSDLSWAAEEEPESYSTLSSTPQEHITSKDQTTNETVETQEGTEFYEVTESRNFAEYQFTDSSRIYQTEVTSQKLSTKTETSEIVTELPFSVHTFASTSNATINDETHTSELEYEDMNSTIHIENIITGDKNFSTIEVITADSGDFTNLTQTEWLETESVTSTPKATEQFEHGTFISSVEILSSDENTLTSESLPSEISKFSTGASGEFSHTSNANQNENSIATKTFSTTGETKTTAADIIPDTVLADGDVDNKIVTPLPLVFTETSDQAIEIITDISASASEETETVQNLTPGENMSPETTTNAREHSNSEFSEYDAEYTKDYSDAVSTDKQETKFSTRVTFDLTTPPKASATNGTTKTESTAFTGSFLKDNDSLSSFSENYFNPTDSYSDSEQFSTYSSAAPTYIIPNASETFSVDTPLEVTSLAAEKTTYTDQIKTAFDDQNVSAITTKYASSPDPTKLTPSDATNETVPEANASTEASLPYTEEIQGTSTTSQRSSTHAVWTTRPWTDIAADVIDMLQEAASHSSSPKTPSTPVDSTPPSSNRTTDAMATTELDLSSADYTQVCGRALPGPVGRIVGGGQSYFGEWPWVVSLRQWKKHTFLHKCGAALVNEFWAITAAHCVEGVPLTDILLRLGEYDITHEEEPLPFVERRVQIVAAHPKFDKRTFEYDLALLRFYEPVTFQRNIIPVCIPEGNNSYVGKFATVTGWGRLYEDGPLPNILQEVELPVITNRLCEEMYRRAGFVEDIPDIFICAGYGDGGRDSCEGDSGGPMVIQEDDGRWVLAGVISWGIGCALPNQPGVYTRITQFSEWINQIIIF